MMTLKCALSQLVRAHASRVSGPRPTAEIGGIT